MSAPVPRIYRHEFHGGHHDGLVLENRIMHPTVYLPMDRPIRDAADYDAWIPTEGQEIGVYIYRRSSVREGGLAYFHLYLDHTDVLVVKR